MGLIPIIALKADSATKPEPCILSDFHPGAATAIRFKDYQSTKNDLASGPQLIVISKQGVGLDKIDVDACKKDNVQVCNTPGVNASGVEEKALCLALTIAREVP
ncbi:d-3-phosphoglycerate dehydrogenase [Fusarium mexicanum]|uniref:D-3-phosphoglycerate dehydrogenase n=1 Tax=Fusarium mexicanum TaxID=751941 RepID=A0A8H5IUW3_9HYPO|nr:d-3-phosphoglycerate dehydrogenase [Fusarium mexicanum]